jgi:multisubunit Na+/H+ antiporter MnhB subunit
MIDAWVLSLSNIAICAVGAVLYLAVNEFEPNRRLAFAQRIAIVTVGAGAIFSHLMR